MEEIFGFFLDPANWEGARGIPTRLLEHVFALRRISEQARRKPSDVGGVPPVERRFGAAITPERARHQIRVLRYGQRDHGLDVRGHAGAEGDDTSHRVAYRSATAKIGSPGAPVRDRRRGFAAAPA